MEPANRNAYDVLFRIVLVGEDGVGKTSLLSRYVDDNFTETYLPTIGVDFKIKRLNVSGTECRLQLWDTSGQERFRNITRSYYRGASAVIMVYSVTNRRSFTELEGHFQRVRQMATQRTSFMLIGNMIDQTARTVQTEEALAFARQRGMSYYEVSARTGQNIENAMNSFVSSMIPREVERLATQPTRPVVCPPKVSQEEKMDPASLWPIAILLVLLTLIFFKAI